MNFFRSSGCNLNSRVEHIYQDQWIYNLATLGQSILKVGSLSINFKIFRVIIQLYSEEFWKGGGHIKIKKNWIQTLCANSDLLYTIVLNHTIISFENKSLWWRWGFGGSAPNKLIASVVGTGVSLRAPMPEAWLTACYWIIGYFERP